MRSRWISHGSWLSLILLVTYAELSFALPDTCAEQGGPAACTGPEIGQYEYSLRHAASLAVSGFLDVADAGEVGVELFEPAASVFAQQDEDQIEQMLER